jgi:hypothetical protein
MPGTCPPPRTPLILARAAQRCQLLHRGWLLAPNPVGAENPVTSCDLQVLVNEAAEAVSSQWSDGRAGGRGSAACGRVLIE